MFGKVNGRSGRWMQSLMGDYYFVEDQTMHLTSIEDVLSFMQSGDARFSVRSVASGQAYNYHVKEYGKSLLLSHITKNGVDVYMARIDADGMHPTAKSRLIGTPIWSAFDWLWSNLRAYQLPASVCVTPLAPVTKTSTQRGQDHSPMG